MNTTSPLGRLDINSHPDVPWRQWAGDPTPLSGETPLVREVNGLYDAYRKRVEYLHAAQQAPVDAAAGVEALHEAYLAEVRRSSEAGEDSTIAADLRAKRDEADRDYRGTAFREAIDGALQAVEQARDRYVSFLELHYAELLADRAAEAVKITRDYAKAHDELEAQLAPLRARWATLYEDSCKTVGYLVGFVRDDLPAAGDYGKAPLPSAESLERYAALTNPAPVTVEPEHAEPTT